MIKENQKRLNRLHVLLDALVIFISYLIAYLIMYYNDDAILALSAQVYFSALIIIIPLFLILYEFFELYTPKRISGRRSEIANISRANTRLMIMTGGQYDLIRREEALSKVGQSGLDLDVIDHYNGTTRSVKSLSGGESFKASLALALGLSDEIQSSAGGIQLDTMFIDEGFGSLDEDSLAQAMNALASLASSNKLIGIISHVGELKQKIDKQIIVKKDKTGGSRAEIIA